MSDARFDDALIAQARAGELRSSGKAQVDAKLLLSALEREVALGAQVKSLREALNAADEWIDRMAGLRDNDTTSRDVLRRIRSALAQA